MPIQGIQLSLFDVPPAPLATPPAAPPLPTFKEVEQTCTGLMMQGDRAQLMGYLNQLCEQGATEWVQKFCRLRTDFGLKVRHGAVVEFFQVGDTIQIHKQGQFYSKLAQVLTLEQGIATVKAENWVVEHRYSVAEIRLVKRRMDGQTD